jgi:formyltetrahydrofolate synthetase
MAAGASAAVVTRHHALGGAGAVDLAHAVVAACSGGGEFKYLYDVEQPIKVSYTIQIFLASYIGNIACARSLR